MKYVCKKLCLRQFGLEFLVPGSPSVQSSRNSERCQLPRDVFAVWQLPWDFWSSRWRSGIQENQDQPWWKNVKRPKQNFWLFFFSNTLRYKIQSESNILQMPAIRFGCLPRFSNVKVSLAVPWMKKPDWCHDAENSCSWRRPDQPTFKS